VSTFGTYGTGNGQFRDPQGIAIDSNNNIFVADDENWRIQKFNHSGVYQAQYSNSYNNVAFLAVDSNGLVYFTNGSSYQITVLTNSLTYSTAWGGYGIGTNGKFEAPGGIAIDKSTNTVYVGDTYYTYVGSTTTINERVEAFTNTGTYLRQWPVTPSQNNNTYMNMLGVDGSGNVYAADSAAANAQKFNSAGSLLSTISGFTYGNISFRPQWVSFDANSNPFYSNTWYDQMIKTDPNGNLLSYFGAYGTANNQLDGPEGSAFDSNGNLYIVDESNSRVVVYKPNF
jgi:sugar lactone lactonase YvrE